MRKPRTSNPIEHRYSTASPITDDELDQLRAILVRGLDAADDDDRGAVAAIDNGHVVNDAARHAGGPEARVVGKLKFDIKSEDAAADDKERASEKPAHEAKKAELEAQLKC